MARLKLTLEYDGRLFSGWQAQPHGNKVQQTVESSLLTLLRSEQKKKGLSLSEQVEVTGSGRTDAGVSAHGQVCHFDLPVDLKIEVSTVKASLNGIFPSGLKVKRVETVNEEFHSRYSPHSKIYSYKFSLKDYSSAIDPELSFSLGAGVDIVKMVEAAREIEGTHDFESFRASDCNAKSTERTILLSELSRQDETLIYRVQGTGFLKQMVRIIAGTLVGIGKGKISSMSQVLEERDRNLAGDTAKPGPLCLEKVFYSSN